MKYRKENYYIVAVNTLQLLKDLNAKKIDLIHIEADQQNAAKTKTENNDSMVKLQQNIKDLELKFAEQKTEFDRDFALLNQQLQENNQEKEKILQTLLEIKPTKDKMLSWKRLRIKDKTEAMTRLKQEIETENNTATIKQEELEIKIRLLQKLENEKASLEKEYDTCFESVVNVKQSIVTVTGMNKPTTSILKRPMISPPSFLPKKKVTFPDLSSQTSSEGSVPVPQPQVGLFYLQHIQRVPIYNSRTTSFVGNTLIIIQMLVKTISILYSYFQCCKKSSFSTTVRKMT